MTKITLKVPTKTTFGVVTLASETKRSFNQLRSILTWTFGDLSLCKLPYFFIVSGLIFTVSISGQFLAGGSESVPSLLYSWQHLPMSFLSFNISFFSLADVAVFS